MIKMVYRSVKFSVSLCQIKFQFIIQNIEVYSGQGLVCQCTPRDPSLHFPFIFQATPWHSFNS